MIKNPITKIFSKSLQLQKLGTSIAQNKNPLSIKGIVGSSFAFIIYSIFKTSNRSIFISFSNKEEAIYFLNDIATIDAKVNVLFFPMGEKKPYSDNNVNTYNLLQRTEVLNILYSSRVEKYIIITFDNAISEKILIADELNELSFQININDHISIDKINERLFELDFKREDFVSQPGDFSVRGGIVDVFSFSNDMPYRIEFFGDQVNRIRTFNVDTQLSESIHSKIKITSNINSNNIGKRRTNVFNVLEKDTIIFIKNLDSLRANINSNFEYSKQCYSKKNDNTIVLPQDLYSNTNEVIDSINKFNLIEFDLKEQKLNDHIEFDFVPQPSFNKSFKILMDNLNTNHNNGYANYICCTNKQQEARLNEIFNDISPQAHYNTVIMPISSGFIDNENKLACYTDHQIFERYHKFKFKKRYYNNNSINLKQINKLNKGDYITHIDHGIGIFSGLQKIDVDGKIQEAIKLIYGERDILYLSIHSLYKISKYSGKDGKTPKIYKLGSKAWALLKEKTKSKVKKIAYDLIKVYAKRKSKKGYRYQKDSYLQTELEASFIYEDTDDQLKVTSEIKSDMESDQPMDRLVCGDVGFGKTEVAIRAAFKAVDNNKQVAILVPTTILAFQHYKTFTSRLQEFPIEHKLLIEGGNLSARFSKLPLSFSHPVFIGAFYGVLLSIILLLPFAYESNWDMNIWLINWLLYSLLLLLMLSLLGGLSSQIIKLTKRMPITVPRIIIYLSPFLGLIILTFSIGMSNFPSWSKDLGLLLMIFPGPVYVHLSWAPRWRLLELIEQNINPFEGLEKKNLVDEDYELNEIVDNFSEE